MDSTGPALSLRPRPQPGGPSRAGLALLAPVSRAALGDAGRDREAPALRMRGLQGRGSQERPAGDRRLPPKQGVRCARAGIGGGRRDRGWGQEKTSRGKWSRWGEKGAHSRSTWDPDGKDRRWPRQGRSPGASARHLERLWRQTPRTALSWVDHAGPGHETPPDHPSLPRP